MRLSDGAVIPSFLMCTDTTTGPTDSLGVFGNVSLRSGEIVGIIYPADQNSISKRFIEYRVNVQMRDGQDPGASVIFPNVMVANLFGAVGDHFTYTLRKQTLSEVTTGYGNGSKVLVLCINGESNSASIIGGIRDKIATPNVLPTDTAAAGLNLNFEFNGLNAAIDLNGQLIITMKGPTDYIGKPLPANPANLSATATFDLNGGISLLDGHTTESVILDNVGQQVNINAKNHVNIKSSGVYTGAATDYTVLGTSYRKAEDQFFKSLIQALASTASQLGQAAQGVAAAATANSAALLAPAAQALVTASINLNQVTQALNVFNKTGPYLSVKNRSD